MDRDTFVPTSKPRMQILHIYLSPEHNFYGHHGMPAGTAPVIEVPLESTVNDRDTAARVEVSINDARVTALLDTGAPRSSISLRAARKAGVRQEALTPNGRVGGAGEDKVSSWLGDFERFQLGGEKVTELRAKLAELAAQAVPPKSVPMEQGFKTPRVWGQAD